MLVVVALAAIEQDLRQIGLAMALLAPAGDALLHVHSGEILGVLQVEHDQRQQAARFTRGECVIQQFGRFEALGLAGIDLARE
ncbi:hypothetical protein D3C71_2061560 [compost metagenome]